jgi:hypothetical protein
LVLTAGPKKMILLMVEILLSLLMSRITYSPVGLSEIVKDSNLIVEVQFVDSFSEEIPVENKESDAPIPPFIRVGTIFNVLAVLKNTTESEIPKTIRVPNENWRRHRAEHKEQYANGPSKSYHIKKYTTEVPSLKEADLLFLHYFQGTYELITKDAYESRAAREKVDILLAAKTRSNKGR